eukprot:351928-Chlamydomonas_euryale.AAC.3
MNTCITGTVSLKGEERQKCLPSVLWSAKSTVTALQLHLSINKRSVWAFRGERMPCVHGLRVLGFRADLTGSRIRGGASRIWLSLDTYPFESQTAAGSFHAPVAVVPLLPCMKWKLCCIGVQCVFKPDCH